MGFTVPDTEETKNETKDAGLEKNTHTHISRNNMEDKLTLHSNSDCDPTSPNSKQLLGSVASKQLFIPFKYIVRLYYSFTFPLNFMNRNPCYLSSYV